MKRLFEIALLVFILFSSCLNANEYSGVWARDCSNLHDKISKLLITQDTKKGLLHVSHPGMQKTESTAITGDNNFKIINHDTLVYKNSRYQRCTNDQSKDNNTKTYAPVYSPKLEEQIKKYLQGEWRVKYQTRDSKTDNISSGKTGLPDLNFLNESQALISVEDNTKPIDHGINEEKNQLRLEDIQLLNVDLINEKELHMSFEVKPASGVFLYYNFGDKK
jgi:hypothetical protein